MKTETAEHQDHPGEKCYRGRVETLGLIEQARLAVLRCDPGTLYRGTIEIEFFNPIVEFPQWDDLRYVHETGKALGSGSPAGVEREPRAEPATAGATSPTPDSSSEPLTWRAEGKV